MRDVRISRRKSLKNESSTEPDNRPSPHSDRTRFTISWPNTDGCPENDCILGGHGKGTGGRIASAGPETCVTSSSITSFIGVVQQQRSDEFESLRGVASDSSQQLKNKHCTSSFCLPSVEKGSFVMASSTTVGFDTSDVSTVSLDKSLAVFNIRLLTRRSCPGFRFNCFLDTVSRITRRWPMRLRASLTSERFLETPRKTTERDSCGNVLAELRRL